MARFAKPYYVEMMLWSVSQVVMCLYSSSGITSHAEFWTEYFSISHRIIKNLPSFNFFWIIFLVPLAINCEFIFVISTILLRIFPGRIRSTWEAFIIVAQSLIAVFGELIQRFDALANRTATGYKSFWHDISSLRCCVENGSLRFMPAGSLCILA